MVTTKRNVDLRLLMVLAMVAVVTGLSCGNQSGAPTAPTATAPTGIRDDASLFRLISQTDAFGLYTVFPNADEFTTGSLNGSEAHRPVIRVSLNATAAGALQNGRLPSGARFPDGSIVFKEIRSSAAASPNLYAFFLVESRQRVHQLPPAGTGTSKRLRAIVREAAMRLRASRSPRRGFRGRVRNDRSRCRDRRSRCRQSSGTRDRNYR